MGHDQGSYFVLSFLEVFDIRQNVIDAGSIIVGKLDAGIDDYNVVAELHHRHILADFFNAAQRDDAKIVAYGRNNIVGLFYRYGGIGSAANVFKPQAGGEGRRIHGDNFLMTNGQ